MDYLFFQLIQVALGIRNNLSRKLSDEEWSVLFEWCEKHAISGFVFPALDKLSEQGQKPPMDLLFEWIGLFEQLRGQNALMNTEAARLTRMLENEGHRTAILKGQANALLYPNPLSRQPGDIDIWVSGGKETVEKTLRKLGILEGDLSKFNMDHATKNYHHIHLLPNENEIVVEVHFRPSSGNYDPFTNHRLQVFLEKEIDRENELTEAGFRVPSLKFALMMQLAHIQRHFVGLGLGMRQIIDYYFLLKSGNNQLIIENGKLKYLGLEKMAEALMWVLHEKLGLEEKYFIAPMDEKRGKMLLAVMMEGGNFGHYSHSYQEEFSITGSLKNRLKRFQLLKFDARETIWGGLNYVAFFVTSIPERIRRRSWTLR
jgi:hypothetical protein